MREVVTTKEQSKNKIIKLNLNRVPEIFIDKSDKEHMEKFFAENVEELYIVRDAEKSSSKYYYVKTVEECFKQAQNFSGKVIAKSDNTACIREAVNTSSGSLPPFPPSFQQH